jgi:hypothetical protein
MRRPLLLAAVLSALVPMTASAGWLNADCDFTANRSARVSANGIRHVTVIARAGSLRIEGRPAASEIAASGPACASSKSLLDSIKLATTRTGDELRVEVQIPDDLSMMQTASLDLTVIVPRGLSVTVRDGSGEATISGTGTLAVTDGSGSIEVHDVAGDVRITDGSGSIDVRKVGGSVDIPHDGSGALDIANVKRNVHIGLKGSGAVGVLDVGGDLVVEHARRNAVTFDRVGGRVSLPSGR